MFCQPPHIFSLPDGPACVFPSYNGRVQTAEVIVAGGGIIGLSVALELARSGRSVHVVERGQVMAEASWAAAGMLAEEDPENPEQLAALATLSRRLYPAFLHLLEELSGQAVPLRTRGTLAASRAFRCADTATRYPISADEAAKRVPGLATKERSFLWLAEASLDPRDLCLALPLATAAAGVKVHAATEVLSVTSREASGHPLVEVETTNGTLGADAFVNCCGAWSGRLQRVAESVRPWKGQLHTVRLQPPLDLPYVLRTPEVYMVPRGNGLVVVGATLERVGFNREIEPTADAWLRALSAELWPPIASAPIVDRWTGLRPGTTDGLPLIGSAGEPGCWVATGHFRNGILLAPATALVVRQLLEGREPEVSLEAFAPGR